ncbi:MAG TPA: class II aldolase/adducin family protein [Solirubrobacteraceae bacterium]|nr:class II aldolase/adducin family protein [Solirubrobacteraceae bacterium]
MLESARERVAVAARALAAEALVIGTSGNVSQRDGELIAVTPTGAVLAELTAAEVAVVDLSGRQRDGELAPTSELGLHLGVYGRYEAGAVVHTHAPCATALACVLDDLPVIHYGLLALGGPVRVARYATFGTPELAAAAVAGLEGRRAVLLANHGTIAYGDAVEQAVEHTRLLEWGAALYTRAAALGQPRSLGAEQCAEVLERFRDYGKSGAAAVEGP